MWQSQGFIDIIVTAVVYAVLIATVVSLVYVSVTLIGEAIVVSEYLFYAAMVIVPAVALEIGSFIFEKVYQDGYLENFDEFFEIKSIKKVDNPNDNLVFRSNNELQENFIIKKKDIKSILSLKSVI